MTSRTRGEGRYLGYMVEDPLGTQMSDLDWGRRGVRAVGGISWAYLTNKVMGWMHGGSQVHVYPDFVLLRRVGGRLGG